MPLKTLPGTTVELPRSTRSVRTLCSSLFAGGGLTLSQVSSLTELSPQLLQNWVKRGFVPPPIERRYAQNQFFRIAFINLFKDNLRIDVIVKLIDSTSADSSKRHDSVFDETALYLYFVEALILSDNNPDNLEAAVKTVLRPFHEPYQGVKKRLATAIKIMILLYTSQQIKNSAGLLLCNLGIIDQC